MTIHPTTHECDSAFQSLKANVRSVIVWLSLLLIFTPWSSVLAAQQPADSTYARAVKLYESGDARETVYVLQPFLKQQKEHADAWYIMGMAQYSLGNTKEARKAFEKVTMLRPNHESARINLAFIALSANDLKKAGQEAGKILMLNLQSAEAHYILGKVKLERGDLAGAMTEATASLQANATYANSYWLKTQVLVSSYTEQYKGEMASSRKDDPKRKQKDAERVQLFRTATESLERYLELKPNLKGDAFWQGQLEAMRAYAGSLVAADPAEAMSDATRPTILSREKAHYTEDARNNKVQGTIVIMVVFSAEGVLKHPLVLKSLGHGLDQEALRAASKIRFVPATRDGKPVSVLGNLEFTFNVY